MVLLGVKVAWVMALMMMMMITTTMMMIAD